MAALEIIEERQVILQNADMLVEIGCCDADSGSAPAAESSPAINFKTSPRQMLVASTSIMIIASISGRPYGVFRKGTAASSDNLLHGVVVIGRTQQVGEFRRKEIDRHAHLQRQVSRFRPNSIVVECEAGLILQHLDQGAGIQM